MVLTSRGNFGVVVEAVAALGMPAVQMIALGMAVSAIVTFLFVVLPAIRSRSGKRRSAAQAVLALLVDLLRGSKHDSRRRGRKR